MDNFVAGLTASMTSVVLFSPLETLRTKLCASPQAMQLRALVKQVKNTQGLKGFYRGIGMNLMTTPIASSLYFSIYEQMKAYFNTGTENKIKGNNMLASVSTGFIVNTITNPLYLLKTKIQSSECIQESKLRYQLKNVYKTQGIKGYYKGLGMSYFSLSHVALYFEFYEKLNQQIAHYKQDKQYQNTPIDVMVSSSVAKFGALVLSYPFNLITMKFQIQSQKQSLLSVCSQIFRENGLKGFFTGMKMETMRALPANAITFMIYESFKKANKAY